MTELGHTGVVKPDDIVVYYAGDGSTPTAVANVEKSTLLVPGLRYVFGFNMDDGGKPTDPDHGVGAWLINGSTGVLDAANAANAAAGGSSTRYATVNAPGTRHRARWIMSVLERRWMRRCYHRAEPNTSPRLTVATPTTAPARQGSSPDLFRAPFSL
jgi:hypothetical protein